MKRGPASYSGNPYVQPSGLLFMLHYSRDAKMVTEIKILLLGHSGQP